jgi:two-component system sensor histidine kinase KdpD
VLLDAPACGVLLFAKGQETVSGTLPTQAHVHNELISVGKRRLGMLKIYRPAERGALTSLQREYLQLVAIQLSVAIDRARLLDEAHCIQQMVKTDRLKSILLASVSHDLKTPLAILKPAITTLLDGDMTLDATTRHDLLHSIDTQADCLNRLIANLLCMSELESGTLHQVRTWYDVSELIVAVVAHAKPLLADRQVTIAIADDLPLVQIHYSQIDQVLTNLLENAAKYTPPGTPIVVRAHAIPEHIQVEVQDSGAGISREIVAHVFDKFVRDRSQENSPSGSGLGLAICRGIITAHEGMIWVEHRPDGGACFVFTLPLPPKRLEPSLDVADIEGTPSGKIDERTHSVS